MSGESSGVTKKKVAGWATGRFDLERVHREFIPPSGSEKTARIIRTSRTHSAAIGCLRRIWLGGGGLPSAPYKIGTPTHENIFALGKSDQNDVFNLLIRTVNILGLGNSVGWSANGETSDSLV